MTANLSNSTGLTFFEIRVPKNSETSPEAMAACFQALPLPKNGLLDFLFGKQTAFSFEMVIWNQRIYFLVAVPTPLSSYFTSQLIAQYPQVLINQVGDFLPFFFKKDQEVQVCAKQSTFDKIVMNRPFYLPLKTYKDFSDIDPLSTVLGALAKADPKDKILVQFLVSKAPSRWQMQGNRVAGQTYSTGEEGKVIPNPQKAIIEQKTAQIGMAVSMRILVCGRSKSKQEAILDQLAGSFASMSHGEANSLKLLNSKIFPQKLFKKIFSRQPDFTSRSHVLTSAELATLYHLPNQNLKDIKNIAWGGTLKGEPPENLPIAINLTDDEKRNVNFFAKTEFKNQEIVFGIKKQDRNKHVYIIGKTGTGKSTLIANMAINDMRNGEGLAVIDPHGDLCDIILDYVPKHRINDVIYLDPNNTEAPFRINPLEVENPEQAELVASGIVAIFHKLFAYSWGPRLEYILRNTILSLTNYPNSTLLDIPRILTNKSFRNKVVDYVDDEILKRFWTDEFNKLDDRARNEAISPILNKVGQFTTFPKIRSILERPKSSVNIEEAMNNGKILILNLSQGKIGEDNAALLGAMMITRIQLAAMARVNVPEDQRRDFFLYVDEFQNFATSSFVKILSEARKYKLNLIVANQYRAQVPEEVQKAIFGNVGTIVSFLVGAEDARMLKSEFGDLYEEPDFVSLNNFEIVLKLSIDNKTYDPFAARTLPLPKSKNQNRDKVIRISTERYGKPSKKSSKSKSNNSVILNSTQSGRDRESIAEKSDDSNVASSANQSHRRSQAEEALAKLGVQTKPDNSHTHSLDVVLKGSNSHTKSDKSNIKTSKKKPENKPNSDNRTQKSSHQNKPHHPQNNSERNKSHKAKQSSNRPRFVVEEVKE
jgi:type IV secretion system coupling TraD/TrwB family protein